MNAARHWSGSPIPLQIKNVAAAANIRKSSGFCLVPLTNELSNHEHVNNCKDTDHKRSYKAGAEQLRDVPRIQLK